MGKSLVKAFCHQQHLPDIVCLLPVCVNLSIVPGAFCDLASLNWNTYSQLIYRTRTVKYHCQRQDSLKWIEFCSRQTVIHIMASFLGKGFCSVIDPQQLGAWRLGQLQFQIMPRWIPPTPVPLVFTELCFSQHTGCTVKSRKLNM